MPVDNPVVGDAAAAGARLGTARDDAGLSLQEVARRLKLTVRMVRAIEENDQRWFPAAVYLRGYVRSYAKLLRLDPEPLVAAYPLPAVDEPGSRSGGVAAVSRVRVLAIAGAVGGLLAVVLVSLLVWQWPQNDAAEVAATDASAVADGPVAAASRVAGEAAGEAAPAVSQDAGSAGGIGEQTSLPGSAADPADVPVPGVEAPGLDSRGVASDPLVTGQAGDVQAGPESADDGNGLGGELAGRGDVADGSSQTAGADHRLRGRRITPFGDAELWFEFAEDCWIEVFDMEGELLYKDLQRRYESLRLIGSGPFQIRLGYAPGVTLEYNGERVPLAPHTRNNVASLVVGQ